MAFLSVLLCNNVIKYIKIKDKLFVKAIAYDEYNQLVGEQAMAIGCN